MARILLVEDNEMNRDMLARRLHVSEVLPNWSGAALDFVVDFVTYVFVPAYAITQSGLLPRGLAVPLGIAIVVSAALYFCDLRMKTKDNHFRTRLDYRVYRWDSAKSSIVRVQDWKSYAVK